MGWPSSGGFPGPDALREALLTEEPEKVTTSVVVCGGLAPTEEGLTRDMKDTPPSASPEVPQTAYSSSLWCLTPQFKPRL